MGKGLASFAVGFGGGYLNAKRQGQLDEERQADRAMRQQEFDARMGEVNDAKNLKLSLADAARPVEVEQGANGMIRPEAMDNRDVGLPENASQPNAGLSPSEFRVKGKNFETQGLADAEATMQNAPDAVAQRQGQAYRLAGHPGAALDIEQKQAQITSTQAAQARKLKEEGVFEAVRALRAGDASGVAKAFNGGGQYKLEGLPEITQDEREVPGIGKIPTYTAKFRVKGPDGNVVEKTYNSHDLSMQMMPYEKALEIQRKGADSDNKFTYQAGMLDAKGRQVELQGELGAARVAAAGAKASGQPSREERLRFTSLYQESGRRLSEAQKALNTLTGGTNGMLFNMAIKKDPEGPEAQQLKTLTEDINTYRQDRQMYQGMLAGSQSGDAPAAQNGPALANARPRAPATQSARDSDQRFIIESELKLAQQRLAQGDTRAQGDIDALRREISRLPGAKTAAAAPRPDARAPANTRPAPAKNDYTHLWK